MANRAKRFFWRHLFAIEVVICVICFALWVQVAVIIIEAYQKPKWPQIYNTHIRLSGTEQAWRDAEER